MTLIIAGKRENFAILASDGLWMPSGEDAPKIACHSSLPIACSVSGLVALPLPEGDEFRIKHSIPPDLSARATTYIRDELDEITGIDDLTTEDIGERLAAKLAPFVNEGNYIACHIAMVKNDKADVGFMVVGRKELWPQDPVDHGAWGWWPNGVRQACSLDLMADLFDREFAQADTSPPQTPDELAAIMRTMVSRAIARDANRSTPKSIGGTAYVAKVTRDGAVLI